MKKIKENAFEIGCKILSQYQEGYNEGIQSEQNRIIEIIEKEVKFQISCQECGKEFRQPTAPCDNCESFTVEDFGDADEFLVYTVGRIIKEIKGEHK